MAAGLAPPPRADDGLYTVYEGLNASWWDDATLTADPRSLVMLRGMLPDTPAVDAGVARRTADRVAEVWTDDAIRGWGRPVLAISATRLGDPARAIYHATAFDYWQFDDAGEWSASYHIMSSGFAPLMRAWSRSWGLGSLTLCD